MGYFTGSDSLEAMNKFMDYTETGPKFKVTDKDIGLVSWVPIYVKTPNKWTKDSEYILNVDFQILGVDIPKWYVSDGSSVPRIFWSLFPPVDKYLLAAILHDYLLDTDAGWSKANKEFSRALKLIGIRAWRYHLIMSGVRVNAWYKTTFKTEKK